ncbi:HD-GYP domain-containing protein [Curvibacter gracilis]|uniref:HD-GYP domain-containing protein n=1 Tax=Curvibacter gracilis TaxID=230310 RepID=UPI0004839FFF|nr:hypothetical protein [Curvibacter gracilis]
MKLVKLELETIPLGHPLPFILRSATGVLLAQKGYVVQSKDELQQMALRGMSLCVDTDESGESHRAYVSKLHSMVREGKTLGAIASTQFVTDGKGPDSTAPTITDPTARPNWHDIQTRASNVLRQPESTSFMTRLFQLHADLALLTQRQTDATLFALMHLSAGETRLYSATHAMLVSVVCMLAARTVLQWPEERVNSLGLAALTMNISMTELQDQLAQQSLPLSSAQVEAIDGHSQKSVDMLKNLGIHDPDWLDAVRHHHDRSPGPLTGRPPAQQMARLIQRADIFGARMAPRATRFPLPSTAAMQGSYFDEDKKVDEAGAALVKAVGMYAPGSYVKLASGEVGVVTRRGATPSTPRVSVVISRQGMAMAEPPPRDTARPDFKITAGLPAREVKVKLPLERLLTLI